MVDARTDPHLDAVSGLLVNRPQRATRGGKLVVVGVVMLLFGLGLTPKVFADEGLIYNSSGTCSFGKEPAPCQQYVSPCVKGVEYFYFPAQGVLRTRDNRIIQVAI